MIRDISDSELCVVLCVCVNYIVLSRFFCSGGILELDLVEMDSYSMGTVYVSVFVSLDVV